MSMQDFKTTPSRKKRVSFALDANVVHQMAAEPDESISRGSPERAPLSVGSIPNSPAESLQESDSPGMLTTSVLHHAPPLGSPMILDDDDDRDCAPLEHDVTIDVRQDDFECLQSDTDQVCEPVKEIEEPISINQLAACEPLPPPGRSLETASLPEPAVEVTRNSCQRPSLAYAFRRSVRISVDCESNADESDDKQDSGPVLDDGWSDLSKRLANNRAYRERAAGYTEEAPVPDALDSPCPSLHDMSKSSLMYDENNQLHQGTPTCPFEIRQDSSLGDSVKVSGAHAQATGIENAVDTACSAAVGAEHLSRAADRPALSPIHVGHLQTVQAHVDATAQAGVQSTTGFTGFSELATNMLLADNGTPTRKHLQHKHLQHLTTEISTDLPPGPWSTVSLPPCGDTAKILAESTAGNDATEAPAASGPVQHTSRDRTPSPEPAQRSAVPPVSSADLRRSPRLAQKRAKSPSPAPEAPAPPSSKVKPSNPQASEPSAPPQSPNAVRSSKRKSILSVTPNRRTKTPASPKRHSAPRASPLRNMSKRARMTPKSPCPTVGTPLDAIREEEESKSPEPYSPQQPGVSRVLAFAQPSGADNAEQTIQLGPRDSTMAADDSAQVNEGPEAVQQERQAPIDVPEAAEAAVDMDQAHVSEAKVPELPELVSEPVKKVYHDQLSENPVPVPQAPIIEPPKAKVAPEDTVPSAAFLKWKTGGSFIESWPTRSTETDLRCSCIAFIAKSIRLKFSFEGVHREGQTGLRLLAKHFKFEDCDLEHVHGDNRVQTILRECLPLDRDTLQCTVPRSIMGDTVTSILKWYKTLVTELLDLVGEISHVRFHGLVHDAVITPEAEIKVHLWNFSGGHMDIHMKFGIDISAEAVSGDQVRVSLMEYELVNGEAAVRNQIQETIERQRSVVKGLQYVQDMCRAITATCSEIAGEPVNKAWYFDEKRKSLRAVQKQKVLKMVASSEWQENAAALRKLEARFAQLEARSAQLM